MLDSFESARQAHQAGESARAEEMYRRLLQREPNQYCVWFALGDLCQALERGDEALACFRQAAEIAPREPQAQFHVANALLRQEKWVQAEAAYRQCLALRPNHLEALVNLGFALGEQSKHDQAESCYRQALAINAGVPEIHQNLGNVLRDRRRLDEAVASYRRALELRPDYAKAHVNLGVALLSLGQVETAVEHLQRGAALQPDFAEAFNSLGAAVGVLRRYDEAHAHYARAIELKPDYAEAHWNRALLWLCQGDFERGWDAYEWRWRCPRTLPKPSHLEPTWDGSPLEGRTILLYAEQGLGDALQFVRYAPLVKARGGRVIVECQRPLLPILASCPGIDQLAALGEPPPKFDVQAALMSLPRILGARLEDVPCDVPYLAADAGLVEHWRRQLAPLTGFRVGIVWQGNAQHPADRHRSAALEDFEPLARVPGVQLISLQKSPREERSQALKTEVRAPGGAAMQVISFGGLVDELAGPFMDTAAIIANLDLVVAVDTAVAHLAGALAAPTWLALHDTADWRWLLDRSDSPWYPTIRLFRQQRRGDWAGVFRRMADELPAIVTESARRPILIEIDQQELRERIARLEAELPKADARRALRLRGELARLRSATVGGADAARNSQAAADSDRAGGGGP